MEFLKHLWPPNNSMKKEPLNSRRIRLITAYTEDLHDDVTGLYENMIDGSFEPSMAKVDDIENKIKLIKDMLKEGYILKQKRG